MGALLRQPGLCLRCALRLFLPLLVGGVQLVDQVLVALAHLGTAIAEDAELAEQRQLVGAVLGGLLAGRIKLRVSYAASLAALNELRDGGDVGIDPIDLGLGGLDQELPVRAQAIDRAADLAVDLVHEIGDVPVLLLEGLGLLGRSVRGIAKIEERHRQSADHGAGGTNDGTPRAEHADQLRALLDEGAQRVGAGGDLDREIANLEASLLD